MYHRRFLFEVKRCLLHNDVGGRVGVMQIFLHAPRTAVDPTPPHPAPWGAPASLDILGRGDTARPLPPAASPGGSARRTTPRDGKSLECGAHRIL